MGLSRQKTNFKWEDVGEREWFEITTEVMQYHFHKTGFWTNPTTGEFLQLGDNKWCGEILVNGVWKYVGAFRTAREAKSAVITAYQGEKQCQTKTI